MSSARVFYITPEVGVFVTDEEALIIKERMGDHVTINELTMDELDTLTPLPSEEQSSETSDAPAPILTPEPATVPDQGPTESTPAEPIPAVESTPVDNQPSAEVVPPTEDTATAA